MDRDYAPAYLGLGRVYDHMGLRQKALNAYMRYLDELPSQRESLKAKQARKAVHRLEKELGITPASAARQLSRRELTAVSR